MIKNRVPKESKRGYNLEDVQEMNRSLIIRLLRQQRLSSRAQLAKLTGLKQSTITNIVSDLIQWGIVSETGIIDGQKGRRSIGVTINTDLFKVIAARLSRRNFSIGLFDLFGNSEPLTEESFDISESPREALDHIRAAIQRVIDSAPASRILGIGVAIPGPFVRRDGKIALMTEFPGWEALDLQTELQSHFQIPVFLEHDANAGALAEWTLGAHKRETGTIVFVAAGQGIGAGIVIDGRLFRGALGTAGEIGHMSIAFDGPDCECGSRGCLEQYCSRFALVRDVKNELGNHPESVLNGDCSFKSIIKAVREGDALALSQLRKIGWYLGFGLVNVVNTFNPDVIIIGDELALAGQPLLEVVVKTVRDHVLPQLFENLVIEFSSLELDPMVVGVGTLVVDRVLQRPSTIERTFAQGGEQ